MKCKIHDHIKLLRFVSHIFKLHFQRRNRVPTEDPFLARPVCKLECVQMIIMLCAFIQLPIRESPKHFANIKRCIEFSPSPFYKNGN